ncbi:MAG TPA: DoxX family protein [Thermoanaerobaculia bacterium]|nr:DoxX family protein [Thermoanaerobaculia bacterium]
MTTFTDSSSAPLPRGQVWTGRVLSTIAVLFLMFDTVFKFLRPPEVVKGTTELGWPEDVILPLGIICLIMLILYLIPRTTVLGALLWTGYLGGAVATHVRIHNPLFSHILFPIYVALLLWGGLWFRDRRVRALLPFA